MKKGRLILSAALLILLSLSSFSWAQTEEFTRGLNYLTSAQNTDGSWGGDSSLTESLPATMSAMETLRILGDDNSIYYDNAKLWLNSQGIDTTGELSGKIHILSGGTDAGILSSYMDPLTFGWGGYQDYGPDNLDTALAILPLDELGLMDAETISYALAYLIDAQNPDGGWGFNDGVDSSVYMTAMVLPTIVKFSGTYNLQTEIDNAVSYLLAKQNPDGGFATSTSSGQGPSTVYETALALMALTESGHGQALPLQNAIIYLTAEQLLDGSWDEDPYSTALALRALANVKPDLSISSSDITFSNPAPTVGDTVIITANIQNNGPAQADNVTISFYDGNPASGGVLLGETIISSIPSYGSAPASLTWTIPNATTNVIFVVVDPLNAVEELNKSDNTADRNLTSATLPDLYLTASDISFFPSYPEAYVMTAIYGKVRNLGETDATDVAVDYYMGDPEQAGTLVWNETLALVPAGGAASIFGVIAPELMHGLNRKLHVIVDQQNAVIEKDETNNLAIRPFWEGPTADLRIPSYLDIAFSPAVPKEGEEVAVNVKIENGGTAGVRDVPVRFYLGDPDEGGIKIGMDAVIPWLPAGSSETVSVVWNTSGHLGNNVIYIAVDPEDVILETWEANNKMWRTLKVASNHGPDFVVTTSGISFSPPMTQTGDMVAITADVRNIGNQDASSVLVEFSLGDPNVGGTLVLDSMTIPFIAKGNSVVANFEWDTIGFAGGYDVYVNIDPFNDVVELDETNNVAHSTFKVMVLEGPDIAISSMDTSGLIFDSHSLEVDGFIEISIENKGTMETGQAFDLIAFEDSDNNEKYDAGTDNILGSITYTPDLSAGATAIANVPVSGSILFRDNRIYVVADSSHMVTELNETNNMHNSGQGCEYMPPVGQFNPVEKWTWTGSAIMPAYDQVMHTPVVARIVDTNRDGLIDEYDVPAIIFISFKKRSDWQLINDGVLRAVRGDTGEEIFSLIQPEYRVNPSGALAAGDIDNDGLVEIVALAADKGIIAFENDGAFKWRYDSGSFWWGGVSLADIDNDGKVEIVAAATVLNCDGTLKWQGAAGTGSNTYGKFSLVADVDLDGRPEVIAGNTVYGDDGTILCRNSAVKDGFTAVGNFDGDPYPEIALVSYGYVYLLDHTCEVIWGPVAIPGAGSGGTPVISDFDGDGRAEIGVAGAIRYAVFKADGSIQWQSVIKDGSSNMTGSSIFDFDGDGEAEVVYSDERYMRIYKGRNGQVLFSTSNTSATHTEYPLIVDIDNDNRAEIVVVANNWWFGGDFNGIRVFEDANDTWVNTRKIWNQHSYHITNVNDDGTIPRNEQNNWETYNNYRCNSLLPDEVHRSSDITTSHVSVDQTEYPTSVRISARIGNGGAVSQPAGVDVSFYDGDPSAGGTIIGTAATAYTIDAGAYQDISLTWDNPTSGVHTIYVIADKDNEFNECREDNNVASAEFELGATTPTMPDLPDLDLSREDIAIVPPDAVEGQTATIKAVIHNRGFSDASGVTVSFYDGDPSQNGILIGTVIKAQIEPGATSLAEITWNTYGQSGRNYLHVVVDPEDLIEESNEGNNRSHMPVDVTPPLLPDLLITSSDITLSDLNPQEGDTLIVTATIHNIGTDAGGVEAVIYDGDPGSGGISFDRKTIYQIIPFGSSAEITFKIETLGLSGNRDFHIVIDPDDKIGEIIETNNTAWKSVTIGPSGLNLNVSSDKPLYIANEDMKITVTVQNLMDSARKGTLEVEILDMKDNVVSKVSSEEMNIEPGEEALTYTWDTQKTLSDDYKVHCRFIEGGNVTAKDEIPVTILPLKDIQTAVAADKISYIPYSTAEITSTVTSQSPNYIFEDLNARIVIIDSNGHIQVTEDKPVLTLLPGQTVPLKTYWNTSTNPKGVYAATLEVFEDAQLISSCQTTFEVLGSTETGKGLMGMIDAQPDPVNQGEDETVAFSITNNGNEDISGLNITVLIVDPDTQDVKQTFEQTTDLPMPETVTGSFIISTADLDPGTYIAILRSGSSSQEEPLTLSSATFTVKDGIPPVVTVISPTAGNLYTSQFDISVTATDDASGIDTVEYQIDEGDWQPLSASDQAPGTYSTEWKPVTTDEGEHTIKFRAIDKAGNISAPVSTTFSIEVLSGTITAQPDPVFQGKEETIAYTISNSGYGDTGDLELTVLIIDTETGETRETFTETVNILSGSTSSGSFTVPTRDLAPKTYSAVLQVMTPAHDLKTLGSVTFEVKPGIEVAKTIPDLKNVLVWLNYPWTSGQDCPDRLLIEQALTEGGWSYFIVLDKKDFERELRNPSYTDFLILGAQHPIEDHFSEELREQIHSGKGLISALFDRQNLNEDLFGIKATGYLPGGDFLVELAESAVSPQGAFQSVGRSLEIEGLNPSDTIGWVIETTKKGTTGHPGIVKRTYGKGNVIFYAFDLGMSTADYGRFETLLANSLDAVHKPIDITAFYPDSLIPAEITIKSLGGSFDLRLTETYPQGLKLYYPADAKWITENPWTIDLVLSPEETRSILYYVLTPDMPGTYSLETEVGYMDNGVYTFYQDLEAEIAVAKDKVTMVNDAIAAIQALSLSGQDKAKAANALKYLENVRIRTITTSGDVEANIADLLKAIESLNAITDADTFDIRLAIDDLLKTWEGAWYLE